MGCRERARQSPETRALRRSRRRRWCLAYGRDHNRHAFSLWLAGGGFHKGLVYGATDEFGYRSVEDVVMVSDLHATLLHALGLDHEQLTFPHDGRADSLTDVVVSRARVIDDLLA